MELLLDCLVSDEGNGMVYAPFFNYSYGDLSMTYEATQHPRTRMGLSDAGAHCGAICDGGTPTFMLTDRTRGPRLPLEHIVHRQTRQTAELYGLRDRGVVAAGMRADLNLIDYDALSFDVPRMAFDLPAGGRRLVQRGRGYRAVFVAGVQTVDDDEWEWKNEVVYTTLGGRKQIELQPGRFNPRRIGRLIHFQPSDLW